MRKLEYRFRYRDDDSSHFLDASSHGQTKKSGKNLAGMHLKMGVCVLQAGLLVILVFFKFCLRLIYAALYQYCYILACHYNNLVDEA